MNQKKSYELSWCSTIFSKKFNSIKLVEYNLKYLSHLSLFGFCLDSFAAFLSRLMLYFLNSLSFFRVYCLYSRSSWELDFQKNKRCSCEPENFISLVFRVYEL